MMKGILSAKTDYTLDRKFFFSNSLVFCLKVCCCLIYYIINFFCFFAYRYNFRELPYGADYFVENVVDPAHVPVSHHNVIGNRYTDSLPIHISVEENISKKGFKVATKLQANLDTNVKSTCNFSAPSLVTLDSSIGDGGMRQILELYISPSKPGFSNHCGRLVLVKDKDGNLPKTFEMFTKP